MSRTCICGECKVTYIPDKVDWSRSEFELEREANEILFGAIEDGNRIEINKAVAYANKIINGPPKVLSQPYWSR